MYNRLQAVERSKKVATYGYAMCYKFTREVFGHAAVGDVDGDGDADAVDGWKATKFRHPGDRNPPAGVPVFWSGGRNGYGHAAVSLGNGLIRSTDAGGREIVATVPLKWVEDNWGMKYLGWTEDLGGVKIPLPPTKPKPVRRGYRVDRAIAELVKAKGSGTRGQQIRNALAALRRIGPLNGKK